MNNIEKNLKRILVPADRIQMRVKELAQQISRDYADVEQFI